MRLSGLLKLIAVLTLGMGFARYRYLRTFDPSRTMSISIADLFDQFLAGVALAVGVGIAIESTRSRGKRETWGLGRWMWMLAAIAFLLGGAREAINEPLRKYCLDHQVGEIDRLVEWVYDKAVACSIDGIGGFLVVFALMDRLSGTRRLAPADGCEWAGRAFGGFLIARWVYGFGLWAHGLIERISRLSP